MPFTLLEGLGAEYLLTIEATLLASSGLNNGKEPVLTEQALSREQEVSRTIS